MRAAIDVEYRPTACLRCLKTLVHTYVLKDDASASDEIYIFCAKCWKKQEQQENES